MANLFRKFSKTAASLTSFSNITHHSPLPSVVKLASPSSLNQFTHFPKPNVDLDNAQKLPFLGDDKLYNAPSFHLFHSFSHVFLLNPAVNCLGYENQKQHLRIEGTDSDGASTIWADSVKKKRKKKMNKHKYKKLRKRLRRKT